MEEVQPSSEAKENPIAAQGSETAVVATEPPKLPNNPGAKKDAEYLLFVKWISLPSELREPRTQKELAVKLNVDEGTLSDWKNRDGFYDLVERELDAWVKEVLPDVYKAYVNETLRNPSIQRVDYLRALAGKQKLAELPGSRTPSTVVPVQVNVNNDREAFKK